MSVAIVTDSTAYLPSELLEGTGVRVVPITVLVAGRPFLDGVDISPSEVAMELQRGKPVTTSRPTPEQLFEAYKQAAADGAEQIVSIHLSTGLSGTYDAARLAARNAPVPVIPVDSRTVAMGLGFSVLAAVRAGRAGAEAEQMARVARQTGEGSDVLFYVDTLEFLRRGGRIGNASALLGNALRVKPILHMVDGEVAPLERARTASRALARLADLAVERAAGADVEVAVQHLAAPDRAADVARRLSERLGQQVVVGEVGAVMGVHVGPGVVAVSVSPKVYP